MSANKKPEIKPGSLCLVKSGARPIHEVKPGDIVTAVEFKGTVHSIGGELFNDVWKVTNARIESFYVPGEYIGISAAPLIPLNDPGLDSSLREEEVKETQQSRTDRIYKELTDILKKYPFKVSI